MHRILGLFVWFRWVAFNQIYCGLIAEAYHWPPLTADTHAHDHYSPSDKAVTVVNIHIDSGPNIKIISPDGDLCPTCLWPIQGLYAVYYRALNKTITFVVVYMNMEVAVGGIGGTPVWKWENGGA